MKLLWIAKGHLTNNFAGVDGGANIRIPLINQLQKLGHEINFVSFPLDMDFVPANISFLGVKDYVEECKPNNVQWYSPSAVTNERMESVDAVLFEVRPSYMSKESYFQNLTIETALAHNKVVLLWDQDIWADSSIDRRFRDKVILLRPYSKTNYLFPRQEFFPYFYHSTSFLKEQDPWYDVVYIGNRYEREYEFMTFMQPLHDLELKVLISGDWVQKAPYVVKQFPRFHWVGSTLHSYTLPLLQLGKCTFHIGRSIMRQYGLTPIRPFEAYMAYCPCFVQQYDIDDYIYTGSNADKLMFNEKVICNENFADMLRNTNYFDSFVQAQYELLSEYSVEHAAARLLQIINNAKDVAM